MLSLGLIYNSLIKNKRKERFDIILEPLQAVIQLALLSSTPIDTKINIYNNILYIQTPTWKQSISRTYYNDSKSDLFFLFNVITRFNKFYNYLTYIGNDDTNLFIILKDMSIKGIDNLLQTYKQTDNPALLHTLQIYKNILRNGVTPEIVDTSNTTLCSTSNYDNYYGSITPSITSRSQECINRDIDSVFINIRNLYSTADLTIIFNVLILLQKNPNNYLEYITGLNQILEIINKEIKKWIVENIIY